MTLLSLETMGNERSIKPSKLEAKLIKQSLVLIKEKGEPVLEDFTLGGIVINKAYLHIDGLFAGYDRIAANYRKLSGMNTYICYDSDALEVTEEITDENLRGSYKIRRAGSMSGLAAAVQKLFDKYVNSQEKETKQIPIV